MHELAEDKAEMKKGKKDKRTKVHTFTAYTESVADAQCGLADQSLTPPSATATMPSSTTAVSRMSASRRLRARGAPQCLVGDLTAQ